MFKNPHNRYFKEEDFLKHIRGIDGAIVSMVELQVK